MNAKGKIRSSGAQLARYVMTGKDGEIVQVVDARGWQDFGKDPVAAFDRMEQWAAEHTKCRDAFFHGHIRNAPGERLTDAQWMESLDRMEKRLGFAGQPRLASFHIDADTGEKHLHVAWCRIDFENERAIDPGLYKNKLVQLSRTLEREFYLRELSSQRPPHDKARAAERDEYEESKRLGTDIRTIRNTILNCLEQSDSGRSFKAALEEKNLMLANGDRRDCFVVIDQEGGHHALNKKLTGMTLAATRERLADLDRSQLPSVEQAQDIQRGRQQQREADRQAEPAAPIWDRDAANRDADATIIDAAIQAE
jgi:Relaxase/Mobilisation nuclease domain